MSNQRASIIAAQARLRAYLQSHNQNGELYRVTEESKSYFELTAFDPNAILKLYLDNEGGSIENKKVSGDQARSLLIDLICTRGISNGSYSYRIHRGAGSVGDQRAEALLKIFKIDQRDPRQYAGLQRKLAADTPTVSRFMLVTGPIVAARWDTLGKNSLLTDDEASSTYLIPDGGSVKIMVPMWMKCPAFPTMLYGEELTETITEDGEEDVAVIVGRRIPELWMRILYGYLFYSFKFACKQQGIAAKLAQKGVDGQTIMPTKADVYNNAERYAILHAERSITPREEIIAYWEKRTFGKNADGSKRQVTTRNAEGELVPTAEFLDAMDHLARVAKELATEEPANAPMKRVVVKKRVNAKKEGSPNNPFL